MGFRFAPHLGLFPSILGPVEKPWKSGLSDANVVHIHFKYTHIYVE